MHRPGIAPIALLLLAVPACQKHLEPWPLSPATSPPASVLRPRQIIDRGLHDGMVTVEIVEPLDEASTTSPAGDAAYSVLVQDVGAKGMLLVPARTRVEREAGAMARLPRRLRPPVRARGVLAGERRDNVTLLIVHDILPISRPEPEHLASVGDLVAHPARWAGKYVEVEATHRAGFESSYLGLSAQRVWLGLYPDAEVRCLPKEYDHLARGDTFEHRVRVRGYAYTKGSYGHLGRSQALIVATHLTYLDPAREDCR